MKNPREKAKEEKEMCSAGIVGRLVMWQPSVGKRMLRWDSTGPRRKSEWEDPSKGSWSKSSWKGKGNPWGSRKETYWFDQTNCSSSDDGRAWAFSVEARTAQDSSEFLNPKISCKPKVWETPPGLSPPVLTSSTWDAFRDSETEFDDEELTMKVDMVKPLKRRKPHMPRSTFISKSQAKKKAKADSMLVDQSMKENDAMMQVPEMLATSENAVMNALCLTTAPCREESVNMVQGWRVRVRSAMDSGCGVSVAPPQECVPLVPVQNPKGRVVVKNSCLPAKIPCRTWESRSWVLSSTMVARQ